MKLKVCIVLLILGCSSITSHLQAQEIPAVLQEVNQDDLGDVTDAFQESFFEALKQKAIENYEKAITALRKCEELQPNNAVVQYELGKNYQILGNTSAAINSFQKANRLKPDQEWMMAELMKSYYANNDYEQAILVAKKLVAFDDEYYNNLADLYFKSQKYDELLALLDQLDANLGINEFRLSLRQQIYAMSNNTPAQIQVLKEAIKANPENEKNHLNLIFVYSDSGMGNEAFAAAEEMRRLFPNSKVVHLALYKFYLERKNTPSALQSMRTVLEAEEIDAVSKLKVLNDFLLFVNDNPTYEEELKNVTSIFAEQENSPDVFLKLGEYFLLKNQKEKALEFLELGYKKNQDNYQLLRSILLLQIELQQFTKADQLSKEALEIFPAQPFFYLIRGVSLNREKKYSEAEEILSEGLDYLIDDAKLQGEFYEQLILTYTELGNAQKAGEYKEKLSQLNKTIN